MGGVVDRARAGDFVEWLPDRTVAHTASEKHLMERQKAEDGPQKDPAYMQPIKAHENASHDGVSLRSQHENHWKNDLRADKPVGLPPDKDTKDKQTNGKVTSPASGGIFFSCMKEGLVRKVFCCVSFVRQRIQEHFAQSSSKPQSLGGWTTEFA